jgi:hypothetical protein
MSFSRGNLRGAAAGACLLLSALLACTSEDFVCVGPPIPGIVLTVVDAVTNADLGQLAVVTVTSLAPGGQALTGPVEQVASFTIRAGTYELRTVAAGYASRTDTVTVGTRMVGGCEETVTVPRTIQLTPQR